MVLQTLYIIHILEVDHGGMDFEKGFGGQQIVVGQNSQASPPHTMDHIISSCGTKLVRIELSVEYTITDKPGFNCITYRIISELHAGLSPF